MAKTEFVTIVVPRTETPDIVFVPQETLVFRASGFIGVIIYFFFRESV